MTYSYTQVSQYLTCPRRYRYRYLDGWREKDTRAAMLFGRAFEQALSAYFLREDPATASASREGTCRSSSRESSPVRMTLSPTSMPSGPWMANAACWNGRRRPPAIRNSPQDS